MPLNNTTPLPKIYFLINSLEGGGAERVVANLSRELIDEFDIDILTLKPGTSAYALPKKVNIISLSGIKKYNILLFLYIPLFVYRFRKLYKNSGYKNGISLLEISNFVHILARKDAIISFRTSIGFFRGFIGAIYRFLIKALYPKAHTIIVNSEENKYELSRYLEMDPDKIEVIYNPIDLSLALSAEKANISLFPNYDEKKKIFITTGRLIGEKHHADIIKSFFLLKEKGITDFLYYIVGSGPEYENLKGTIESYGLDEHVFLLGQQSDIFSILKRAHYFLYASEVEGFPNVLIEAMAVGLPIITTDFKTGAREVILSEYKNLTLDKFPVYGPNGILLQKESFIEEFVEIYPKLDTLTQQKMGISRFETSTTLFRKILLKED